MSVKKVTCLGCGDVFQKDWHHICGKHTMPPVAKKVEAYKCLALSTGHLTEGIRDHLKKLGDMPEINMVMSRDSGFFVKLYSHDGEINPADFNYFIGSRSWKAIIELAVEHNCQLIEFDRDVPETSSLKTFEW